MISTSGRGRPTASWSRRVTPSTITKATRTPISIRHLRNPTRTAMAIQRMGRMKNAEPSACSTNMMLVRVASRMSTNRFRTWWSSLVHQSVVPGKANSEIQSARVATATASQILPLVPSRRGNGGFCPEGRRRRPVTVMPAIRRSRRRATSSNAGSRGLVMLCAESLPLRCLLPLRNHQSTHHAPTVATGCARRRGNHPYRWVRVPWINWTPGRALFHHCDVKAVEKSRGDWSAATGGFTAEASR